MTSEQVHGCESCGHAYTASYGQWVTAVSGMRWLCHPCAQQVARRREGRREGALPKTARSAR